MKRSCPSCNKLIVYKTYKVFWKSKKNNSTCRSCFYKSLNGYRHSDLTKKKIGKANAKALLGNLPYNKGVPMSDQQKQKCRTAKLRFLEKYGIPSNQDLGSDKLLKIINDTGFKFEPKIFSDLGYIADGYDSTFHIWLELDPPHHYHKIGSLKPKDIERQQNIIRYFEKKHPPLKDFVRVRMNKGGTEIYGIYSVLKGEM